MKGTEHFRRAEQLLLLTEEDFNNQMLRYLTAKAQVHATLAAATAVSNLVTVWGDIAKMMRADSELADAEPVPEVTPFGRPVEPLVMCNARPADDGPERCHLAMGHDGLHEHDAGGGRIVSWSTPAEMTNVTPDRPYIQVAGAEPFYLSTATDLNMEMPR